MRRTKVFWKEKGRAFKCPPREFLKIQEEHEKLYGGLDEDVLIEESADSKHPLHDDVWADSDDVAAAKHRLSIIKSMARSLVVVHVHGDQRIETRAIVSSRPVDGSSRRFRSVRAVMADPDARDALVAEALARFQSLKREYAHIRELAALFRAIDEASEEAA